MPGDRGDAGAGLNGVRASEREGRAMGDKADANQKVKERVGAQINAAIGAYKQSHLK